MKKEILKVGIVGALLTLFVVKPVYVSATQGFTENPGSSWISLNSTNGSQFLLHNSADGNSLEFASSSGGVMNWQTLSINKNGTVGIGNSSPSGSRFQVNASSGWSGRFMNQASDVRLAYPGYGIYVSTSATGGEYLLQLNKNTTPIFQVGANGNAHLDGTLRVKEVQVKSNVWADYVFDKDYKLMPLSEVEKYIEENNHLPNIPSAKDIEAQGISVGEMQRLQMEKIEELTLHLIEKDKQIQRLEERLSKLENLIVK